MTRRNASPRSPKPLEVELEMEPEADGKVSLHDQELAMQQIAEKLLVDYGPKHKLGQVSLTDRSSRRRNRGI